MYSRTICFRSTPFSKTNHPQKINRMTKKAATAMAMSIHSRLLGISAGSFGVDLSVCEVVDGSVSFEVKMFTAVPVRLKCRQARFHMEHSSTCDGRPRTLTSASEETTCCAFRNISLHLLDFMEEIDASQVGGGCLESSSDSNMERTAESHVLSLTKSATSVNLVMAETDSVAAASVALLVVPCCEEVLMLLSLPLLLRMSSLFSLVLLFSAVLTLRVVSRVVVP
mmetsp:Transcript_20369/g.56698  ORF Transcript_20369/g.56698 Transcript_20369/m.56698 type:complete len:225 (+) Transcript_20369:73-747(+)